MKPLFIPSDFAGGIILRSIQTAAPSDDPENRHVWYRLCDCSYCVMSDSRSFRQRAQAWFGRGRSWRLSSVHFTSFWPVDIC